ncbi:MAG: hypothetical protein QOF76_4362 [Solirubrobacteraceae bacterium]|jgi:hypothetical protein|nr:hypothetical protein [Solirubrobacteraceae bacterium]
MFVASSICTSTPIDALEAQLVAVASALERGLHGWLGLVAEFDARGGAARWGSRTTAEWLGWRCGISARAAREHVRVARRLAAMPLVNEAFEAGEVSYSKVRAVTRAGESEDEATLLQHARTMDAHTLERTVAALRSAPSADPAVAADVHAKRRLDVWSQPDGMVFVLARLPAYEGAIVDEVLSVAAEKLHPAGPEGLPRPCLGARRADALVEILQSGAPRAHVILHVDAAALATDDEGVICALEAGPAIPSVLARRLACDAELRLARHGPDGALDYGRRRRVVSPSMRTVLARRDGGCRFPGCTRRHDLEAHHIEHWAHGGGTDEANLVLFCKYHHRLHHEEGFIVERRGDEFVFRRPGGELIAEVRVRAGPLVAAA